MGLPERIIECISPTVVAMGYEVVRVLISGKERPRLQVMAERRDGTAMTVEDCAGISRAISAVLDIEDPIHGAYTLEVSSPGIDRPLVRLADFQRFQGFDARVETGRPIDGRKRFRGRLIGVDGESVRVRVEGTTYDLPHADIARAKLLLTDELLAAAGDQNKQ